MLVPTRAAILAVTALLVLPLVGLPAYAADGGPTPSAEALRDAKELVERLAGEGILVVSGAPISTAAPAAPSAKKETP